MDRKLRAIIVASSMWLSLSGCSDARAGEGQGQQAAAATPSAGTIALEVTEAGFVPNRIEAKKGEPLKLVITRKTDATCAKEIVIDEHGIETKLPLDTAVTVSFTPKQSGELKFGCAMDKMIGGVLLIE